MTEEHLHACGHLCGCQRALQPECVACRVKQVPWAKAFILRFRYRSQR